MIERRTKEPLLHRIPRLSGVSDYLNPLEKPRRAQFCTFIFHVLDTISQLVPLHSISLNDTLVP